jgi:hypothetical protein
VDIRVVGIEVNHLGEVFEGNINQLKDLLFENGYEYLGSVEIDSFFIKKNVSKKKKKSKK